MSSVNNLTVDLGIVFEDNGLMLIKKERQMQFAQALEIVNGVGREQGVSLLETLQYMDANLFQFDQEQRAAFRVVFNEMRKLFTND